MSPENIPESLGTATISKIIQECWWSGIDHCLALNNDNLNASLNEISTHILEVVFRVTMSLRLLPREILENIVLVKINKNLQKGKT